MRDQLQSPLSSVEASGGGKGFVILNAKAARSAPVKCSHKVMAQWGVRG